MKKGVHSLGAVRLGSGGRMGPSAHKALPWAPVLDEEGQPKREQAQVSFERWG